MNDLRFTLEGGVDFTGNVLLELANARRVTIDEVRKMGSEGKLSFKELESAVSAAAAIQHAKEAVTHKRVMEEEAEHKANFEALNETTTRFNTEERYGPIWTNKFPMFSAYDDDESIEADSDSVVIFRPASDRWESISIWGDDEQELADLLLTQKIIDSAVTIAKQNSRWGI